MTTVDDAKWIVEHVNLGRLRISGRLLGVGASTGREAAISRPVKGES